MANRVNSPCGACKFLRRRCVTNCIFAPYFCSTQGSTDFAAIHKVFGASNFSKLLLQLPVHNRYAAVISICFEARARLNDPTFGCVSHIITLQQQIIGLQAQLMQARAHQAQCLVSPRNQWATTMVGGTVTFPTANLPYLNMTSWPQYSIDNFNDGGFWQQEMYNREDVVPISIDDSSKKRAAQSDIDELQALALKMTKTESKF